jgi:general secretion pathway protein E
MAKGKKVGRRGDFNLAFVVAALERAGLLTADQRRDLEAREVQLRARITRERGAGGHYEVSPVELVAALGLKSNGRPLDEDAVSVAVAREAGIAHRKIDPLKLDMNLITRTFSRPYAERHAVLPLEWSDGTLYVAVANPFDRELVDSLHQVVDAPIQPVLSSKTDIMRAIQHVYGFKRSVAAVVGGDWDGVQLGDFEQLVRLSTDRELDASDQPVVAAVEYLLRYAFDQRASDIHIEPRRNATAVRLRIDGVLHPVYTLPRVIHAPVVSRLKALSRMDIAEKRRPQDGRIKTDRAGREVELRVSTIPTAFGEKVVVRVFDPEALVQDLGQLGFADDEYAVFQSWLARSHGMILVTGPTGSGKTTTLYSALRALARPDVNVVTIEDPIEMVFDGLSQIQIQPRIDLDFAQALRHVLRQDPDIIMVGEIRDGETARAAVQAALTGHLVLSTLHTNTASDAVTRLRDLGVEPFLIAASVVGVLAQRLVRTVCPYCAVDTPLTVDEAAALAVRLPDDARPRRGDGCLKCRTTGYLGRTAIFDLLTVDNEVRDLVASGEAASAVEKHVRVVQGMSTLREAGARKVALGQTTVEEVVRATTDAAGARSAS